MNAGVDGPGGRERERARLRAAVVALAACACAHAPKAPSREDVNQQLMAKAVWWATRVPEPASRYETQVAGGFRSERLLEMATEGSDLAVAGPDVLQRTGDASSSVVRLAVQVPERVTAEEVRIPFSHARVGAQPTECAVRIRVTEAGPASWSFSGEGKEHCWPRPSSLR